MTKNVNGALMEFVCILFKGFVSRMKNSLERICSEAAVTKFKDFATKTTYILSQDRISLGRDFNPGSDLYEEGL
jgi:hypothetical protein